MGIPPRKPCFVPAAIPDPVDFPSPAWVVNRALLAKSKASTPVKASAINRMPCELEVARGRRFPARGLPPGPPSGTAVIALTTGTAALQSESPETLSPPPAPPAIMVHPTHCPLKYL